MHKELHAIAWPQPKLLPHRFRDCHLTFVGDDSFYDRLRSSLTDVILPSHVKDRCAYSDGRRRTAAVPRLYERAVVSNSNFVRWCGREDSNFQGVSPASTSS